MDEAVGYLEVALSAEAYLPPDALRRAVLLLELGEAKDRCGRIADARDELVLAAQLAGSLGRSDLLARAAMQYAGMYAGSGSVGVEFGDTRGRELAQEALNALPARDSRERVYCLAKLSSWHSLDPDPALQQRLAADALSMAKRLDDPSARAWATFIRMESMSGLPGGAAEQLRLAGELERLAVASGEAAFEIRALYFRTMASQVINDMATARETLQAAQLRSASMNLLFAQWLGAAIEATFALAEGRFDELPALNERERSFASAVGAQGILIADAHHLVVACQREEWDERATLCTSMLDRHGVFLAAWGLPVLVAWARGQRDEAREALASWRRSVLPFVPAGLRFLVAGFLARATADLEMDDVAQLLCDILEPHSGTWCTNSAGADCGMTDHSLGLLRISLGDPVEGRRLMHSAIDAYRAAGARAWLAVALTDLAHLAVDASEAAAAAAEAQAIANGIGAPKVARRAMLATAHR